MGDFCLPGPRHHYPTSRRDLTQRQLRISEKFVLLNHCNVHGIQRGTVKAQPGSLRTTEIEQRHRVFLKIDRIIPAHELQKKRDVFPLLPQPGNICAPTVVPFLEWTPV